MFDALGTVLPAAAMPYIELALGLAALVVCGNWLVTGSVQLARFLKVGTFIVGLTVVAYGTSAPEMFISVGASLRGADDIAIGNVIGSNIANIGAILATVALIATIPIRNRALAFDLAAMFAVTALLFVFGLDSRISRVEGIVFVCALAAYTSLSVVRAKKRATEVAEAAGHSVNPLAAAALILASLVGLKFGADWFVEGARGIALRWGVSERVIAVSIVAVGTSSPELVTSLLAVFRKENDLSIGNIIGSNMFNIAGVLGFTAVISPLSISSRSLFVSDMIWLFAFSALLFMAERRPRSAKSFPSKAAASP
jgi:cation:H+ antiporter